MMHQQWNREKLRHFESGFYSLKYTPYTAHIHIRIIYRATSQQGMGIYSARYCCLNKKDGLKDLITKSPMWVPKSSTIVLRENDIRLMLNTRFTLNIINGWLFTCLAILTLFHHFYGNFTHTDQNIRTDLFLVRRCLSTSIETRLDTDTEETIPIMICITHTPYYTR